MGFVRVVKTLVAIYVSVCLLILKKLRIVLRQRGEESSSNFGLFLGIVAFLRSQFGQQQQRVETKRSFSLPTQTIQRSTSIRERRRNLSADNENPATYFGSMFAHHQFLLKKRTLGVNTSKCHIENATSSLSMRCKKSLIEAKEAKNSM